MRYVCLIVTDYLARSDRSSMEIMARSLCAPRDDQVNLQAELSFTPSPEKQYFCRLFFHTCTFASPVTFGKRRYSLYNAVHIARLRLLAD